MPIFAKVAKDLMPQTKPTVRPRMRIVFMRQLSLKTSKIGF